MAYQDVACAIPARMASMTADSSTSVFSDTAGIQQALADVGGLDEGTIVLEADVTDASILADLGINLLELPVVGEAGTQRGQPRAEVAPGTLLSRSSLESQSVDGVFGRDSVVSGTMGFPVGGVAGSSTGRVAFGFADGLAMGSSPLLHQRGVPGGAVLPALPVFPALQPPETNTNVFGREVVGFGSRDSQYSQEAPNNKPLLFLGSDADVVSIPKRLYSELLESKQHLESMMMVVSKLENKCKQQELDMQNCKVICKAACERVIKDSFDKCSNYQQRLEQYEAYMH